MSTSTKTRRMPLTAKVRRGLRVLRSLGAVASLEEQCGNTPDVRADVQAMERAMEWIDALPDEETKS